MLVVMTKNTKIIFLALVVLLLGVYVYYSLQSKLSSSEKERMQALIDSTTAPATTLPLSAKEEKKLIDSTTAPESKKDTNY